MHKLLTSLLALLLGTAYTLAIDVRGTVNNSDGEPEAFATTRIYAAADTVKPAAFGITDDLGKFTLSVDNAGDYILEISSVGKKTITLDIAVPAEGIQLEPMTMAENAEQLAEVQVLAKRPLVVREIDRIGYDVQADEDSKTTTVREILRKVPMVTVDADGTIKVKGSSNFKIYKNGRPNNAFTQNAKDIFAAIPASMIKRIEVITDPGAREDAEGVGAILNIVTNETSSTRGVMGNIGIQWETRNLIPVPNVWLTTAFGKLTLSAHGGGSFQTSRAGHQYTDSEFTYVNTKNTQKSNVEARTSGAVGFWGLDASYELDSLNLFTAEFSGFSYGVKQRDWLDMGMFDPSGTPIYSYSSYEEAPSYKYLTFSGNFNYQHSTRRKGETITLSYMVSNNNNSNESTEEYYDLYNIDMTGRQQNSKTHFIEQTGQADWTRPFGEKHTLSIGAKFIDRRNTADETRIYEGTSSLPNEDINFKHITTIAAGYLDYRLRLGKWNTRAGIRYEYSHLAAKYADDHSNDFGSDLDDWVPNASVMYNINDANSLKLAWSTRINRPGINYLNPVKTYSPTSVQYGNPDLESTRHNNFSLNYSLIKPKINIDFNASYEFANNTITSFTTVDDKDFRTTTYGNVGKREQLYFSTFVQWNISRKTSLSGGLTVNHTYLSIPDASAVDGSRISNARWGVTYNIRFSQQLPWKLRGEIMNFFYNSGLNNVYSYDDNRIEKSYLILSLQRSFLKEDRLTVRAFWFGPLNFSSNESVTRYDRGPYTGYTKFNMAINQSFGVGISYRFGNLRSSVKKVAGITNDDLQGGTKAPM